MRSSPVVRRRLRASPLRRLWSESVRFAKRSGKKNLLLVLDSNEFIFALGLFPQPSCRTLIEHLIDAAPRDQVRVPRTIIQEVLRHLTPEASREFFRVIQALGRIDEDAVVPFELGSKYEWQGLKPADAFIAAYAEWVGAETLITENRHFLTRHAHLPFRVMTAHAFLSHHKHPPHSAE